MLYSFDYSWINFSSLKERAIIANIVVSNVKRSVNNSTLCRGMQITQLQISSQFESTQVFIWCWRRIPEAGEMENLAVVTSHTTHRHTQHTHNHMQENNYNYGFIWIKLYIVLAIIMMVNPEYDRTKFYIIIGFLFLPDCHWSSFINSSCKGSAAIAINKTT